MSVTYTNFNGRIVHENRGGTERGYVPDPLGSTVALVDSTGAVTDTWEYAAYGEVESHSGSSTTPFTFVGTLGYFRDIVSKLTYVRARYYQAFMGQWMTVDPLWPRLSSYQYSMQIPVSLSDAAGLDPVKNKCRMTFWCFSSQPIPVTGCFFCLQTSTSEGRWETVKCWAAGSGRDSLPADVKNAGRIPPGRWCFDREWFDMGAISGNLAWGEGAVCMRLRPCDSEELGRLQGCYPEREFHSGSFTIHGGAEYNRYRSSGCVTIRSSEVEELKRLIKEKCSNPNGIEVIAS
ncbi:MAG: RHS repeat-associated core domain-containing protein [Fimbriimonadaceae bacterium]